MCGSGKVCLGIVSQSYLICIRMGVEFPPDFKKKKLHDLSVISALSSRFLTGCFLTVYVNVKMDRSVISIACQCNWKRMLMKFGLHKHENGNGWERFLRK